MHFMDCCDLTYSEYINVDNSIDIDKYGIAFKQIHGSVPTIKISNGHTYWVHN
jgi:hypothetical protein